ncbi:MAG: DUF1513 domain-containing protein [Pseudomonadota bacterium]
MIARREILGLFAVLTTSSGSLRADLRGAGRRRGSSRHDVAFVGCRRGPDGAYWMTALDPVGEALFDLQLPDRGHGVAVHPRLPLVAVVARRPGRFMHVVNLREGTVIAQAKTPPGQHFQGHACFSPDGRRVLATENAYEAGVGLVGIYDALRGYERVGQFDAHGIGPHEIIWGRDASEVIVAVGGIRRHPDYGAAKLNLDSMRSSVVRLDARTGALRERLESPEDPSTLSLRHLALDQEGAVLVAAQHQGARTDPVALLHRQHATTLRGRRTGRRFEQAVRHYAGSVAVSGGIAGVTHPRGDAVSLWHLARKHHRIVEGLEDVSGIAPHGDRGQFVLSGGTGWTAVLDARDGSLVNWRSSDGWAWDNHLVAV